VNRVGGSVTIDRYGMTIVDLKEIGYKDEPCVLTKDLTHVFYVKDMAIKYEKIKASPTMSQNATLFF